MSNQTGNSSLNLVTFELTGLPFTTAAAGHVTALLLVDLTWSAVARGLVHGVTLAAGGFVGDFVAFLLWNLGTASITSSVTTLVC